MKVKTGINIELIPVGQPVGPLTWQMSMNGGKASGPNSYPVADVPQNTQGELTFTIRHPGPIVFDSFCAQLGKTKPTGCDNQFIANGLGKSTMVVTDSNTTAGDYTYVINFKNAPSLDPIIKNGGGGGIQSASLVSFEAIGALLVLVALVFVARRMFTRSEARGDGMS